MADAEINDGVHLIMTGDFQGGMERLQSALAEEPDKSRVARIHKNMGVAYAQKKQPADAVPHLKIYLKLQADAPDRAKFESYIKQFESRGGK
jgi:Tfp pilus assembly protein PilF